MKTFIQFIAEGYDFKSTQIKLPICITSKIIDYAETIPDDELTGKGRELRPHITIKYGIHDNCPDQIMELELPESITVTLGTTSVFGNDTGDVLNVDVESAELHKLNKLISKNIKVTDTFPTYIPHCTIAYLKTGMGKKYNGDDTFKGLTFTCTQIEFSGTDGKITPIELGK